MHMRQMELKNCIEIQTHKYQISRLYIHYISIKEHLNRNSEL